MYIYSTRDDGELAPRTTDFFDPDVIARRRAFLDAHGLNGARAVAGTQKHEVSVYVVTEADTGKGIEQFDDTLQVDALVTDVAHLPLVIKASDCVPVLMWSDDGTIIAAVHAGWRSIVADIITKTLHTLSNQFDVVPKDIHVWIGPHLRSCCFATGDDVAGNEIRRDFEPYGAVRGTYADATMRVVKELEKAGVDSRHVHDSGICTLCDVRFFSNRRGDISNNLFCVSRA